jgi:DNA repair exonuclease SbcCD ATPase subunit
MNPERGKSMNTTKAYEEKISSQLQQTKAQLEELEARAKGKMAQAEIETINHLKAKQQEIEKKRQDLKTSGDAKVEQVKAEIDAEMAKFKTSLEQLATKLKGEARTKAGG